MLLDQQEGNIMETVVVPPPPSHTQNQTSSLQILGLINAKLLYSSCTRGSLTDIRLRCCIHLHPKTMTINIQGNCYQKSNPYQSSPQVNLLWNELGATCMLGWHFSKSFESRTARDSNFVTLLVLQPYLLESSY